MMLLQAIIALRGMLSAGSGNFPIRFDFCNWKGSGISGPAFQPQGGELPTEKWMQGKGKRLSTDVKTDICIYTFFPKRRTAVD